MMIFLFLKKYFTKSFKKNVFIQCPLVTVDKSEMNLNDDAALILEIRLLACV